MVRFNKSHTSINRFFKNRDGIAATEFAFIVPIMLLLFFGAIEGTVIHSAGDRVARAANILSDVPTKSAEITIGEIDDLFIGITKVIQPIDTLELNMNIVSVIPDKDGNPIVHWSRSNDPSAVTPYKPGDDFDLQGNMLLLDGFSVVVAEVNYVHDSGLTGKIVDSAITYDLQKTRAPRLTPRVNLCQSFKNGVFEDCTE